jgi:regulator of protease activity HflC (stomatin/prohibitin superfamily)
MRKSTSRQTFSPRRKIAEELERTYDAQREAQIKRQALQRETSVANLQAEVVRAEQMVSVAKQNAIAAAETARGESQAIQLRAEGEGEATRLRAEGQAAAVRVNGEAEAASLRAVGGAKAEAYKLGMEALGAGGYTAAQVATILGEHNVKVVPDIAVSGESGTGLASVLMARLIQASKQESILK